MPIDARSDDYDEFKFWGVNVTDRKPLPNKYISTLVILVFLIIFLVIFSTIVGDRPNDYTFFIRPSTINWMNGETTLYDLNAHGFYFMPWSLWLFVPTVWFPPAFGQGILNLLTLLGVLLALRVFGQGVPLWLKTIATIPFSLFLLLITGNIDGVVLLGFCLSFWALQSRNTFLLATGIWLATLKPINTLPLLIFVLLLTWKWSWKDKFKGISFLLISFIISFPLFGWDWPLRYYQYVTASPPLDFPIVTIWKLGDQFNIHFLFLLAISAIICVVTFLQVYSSGISDETFALVTAGWMLITPYALDIHYVLLVPAFLITARHIRGVAVIAYLTTYLPLLRIPYGFEIKCIDLVYPIMLWLSILYILRSKQNTPEFQITQNKQ
jgi:hypothetical protein